MQPSLVTCNNQSIFSCPYFAILPITLIVVSCLSHKWALSSICNAYSHTQGAPCPASILISSFKIHISLCLSVRDYILTKIEMTWGFMYKMDIPTMFAVYLFYHLYWCFPLETNIQTSCLELCVNYFCQMGSSPGGAQRCLITADMCFRMWKECSLTNFIFEDEVYQ